MTANPQTRLEEVPFDEPVEEPPAKLIPYAEPRPKERPCGPLDPKPLKAPPEAL